MHGVVHAPEFAGPLARVALERLPFLIANLADVQVEIRPEAERLLVRHDLEEVEVPAAGPLIRAPDERADDVMIGVAVHRPVGHDDVRLDLLEPSADGLLRLRVRLELLVRVREEVGRRAQYLAGGRRLPLPDGALGFSVDLPRAAEARAVREDDLMALAGEEGDESAGARFGIVRVAAEDDDAQLPVLSRALRSGAGEK